MWLKPGTARAVCGLGLAAFAIAGICSNVAAEAVTGIAVDGVLGDWGVLAPTTVDGNTWAPSQGAWESEDSTNVDGVSGKVGPLFGGQNFDIEALYTGFDIATNMLYVAFVTGFDIEGETAGGNGYFVGDVFIDFGFQDTSPLVGEVGQPWDLAFDLSSRSGTAAGSTVDAIGDAGVAQGDVVYDETPLTPPGGFASGAYIATGGTVDTGGASFAYTDNWGGGDHNVYEFGYQVTNADWLDELILGGVNSGGWTARWTMSCGNDVLEVAANPVPVPAAAPMVLLGMGMVGFARRRRRGSKC